jgi:hypothetical protein
MSPPSSVRSLLLVCLGLAPLASILAGNAAAADAPRADAPPRALPVTIPVAGMRAVPEDNNRVSGLALTVEGGDWPALTMLGHPFSILGALGKPTDHPFNGLGPVPMPLGAVRMDGDGRLADQQVNSVSNTLTYGDDHQHSVKLTMTRLSPAVLIEAVGDALELFAAPRGSMQLPQDPAKLATWDEARQAMVPLRPDQAGPFAPVRFPPAPGLVKPLRWAVPRADGTIQTGVMAHQPSLAFPFLDWHVRFAPVASLAPDACTMPPVAGLGQRWLLLWYGSGSPILSSKVPAVLTGGMHFSVLNPANQSSLYQGDVPLLLVFGRDPRSIDLREGADGSQLLVSFADQAGTVAMVPLFGHDIPPAATTEQWLKDFPAEIARRCDGWAKRLGAFPVDAHEVPSYDAKADRITCDETFDYVDVRPGAARTALLRPMLALSAQQKLPAISTPASEDLQYATQFGPLLALPGDRYRWSVDGVGRYVSGQPTVGPGTAETAELEAELSAAVDQVLTSGHLAPWVTGVGGLFEDSFFVYGRDPAEVLYGLSEILPVLPRAQQDRVREYMTKEEASYPPDQVTHLTVGEGARREYFMIPKDSLTPFETPSGKFSGKDEWYEAAPSLFRAYAMAQYYRASGTRPPAESVAFWRSRMKESLEDRQWDTMGWYWGKYAVNRSNDAQAPKGLIAESRRRCYSQFTLRAVHRDLAGLIGYLRICQAAGVPAEPEAWGQVAKLLALRCSLARYGRYLLESGLYRHPGIAQSAPYSCLATLLASKDRMEDHPDLAHELALSADFSKPDNHYEQVSEVDQHEVTMTYGASTTMTGWYFGFNNPYGGSMIAMGYQNTFLDLVPEVGRMMADMGLQEDVAGYLRHYARIQSVWYKAHAENIQFCTGEAAGIMPNDSYQLFMAHAWIARTPPATLRGYVDIPWTRFGDFFYLHKLAETIKAYRGESWTAASP